MKRLYFLLICMLIGVQTFAQDKWSDIWCDTWNVLYFDGMRFEETASTSHYQLGEDTIIGDYTYSKFTSRVSVRFTEDKKVYVYYYGGFDDNDPHTPEIPEGEYLAYDFSAQVGDTLEVFSGIGTCSTYACVIDDVQLDSQTNLRTITQHVICRRDIDGDGVAEEEFNGLSEEWIEGVGSPEGFLIRYNPCGLVGVYTAYLLCAYQGDELQYTGGMYDEYGCEYNTKTAVEDTHVSESNTQKVVQDNQLLIQSNDKTYNVMGIEVK